MIPLAQQYVYVLVARKYNFTGKEPGVSDTCLSRYEDSQIAELRETVNSESSLIVLYLNIAELLPTCFIVLAMGCWSDATGRRKFLMWLPCLGNAMYALGFLLPSYIYGGTFTSGGAAIIVTSTIMAGLSGNIHGFLSGNACYISDTDTLSRRTLRLAIVEAIVGVTFGGSSLGLGYWIDAYGFIPALWFVFACSLIPFFLIIFGLSEPQNGNRERAPNLEDFKSVSHICGCQTLSQRKLWAMFFAYIIYVFVQQGQERTNVLYLENYPLCWGSINIGIFLFVLYFLSGLGAWPGVPLLHKVRTLHYLYSRISISRCSFPVQNSRNTPYSSPWRARYRVYFASLISGRSFTIPVNTKRNKHVIITCLLRCVFAGMVAVILCRLLYHAEPRNTGSVVFTHGNI